MDGHVMIVSYILNNTQRGCFEKHSLHLPKIVVS
jgi:hypothetical protein